MWTPSLLVLEILLLCLAGLWLVCGWLALAAALFWDRQSGARRQVKLEMQGEFLQVLLPFTMGLSICSLFLTVHTADTLHPFLTGAMCAFAVFTFSGRGLAVLYGQIALAVLTGLWLVFNRIDRITAEQPFLRRKYAAVPLLALLFFADCLFFVCWLKEIQPDTLVSCCGDLFNANATFALPQLLNALQQPLTLWIFALLVAAQFTTGALVILRRRLLPLFSAASLLLLPMMLLVTTLYIAQYAFENPVHRCPFCLLQEPDGVLFWLLYLSIGTTAVCGGGVGFFLLRSNESAQPAFVRCCRRLVVTALSSSFCSLAIMGIVIVMSDYTWPQ